MSETVFHPSRKKTANSFQVRTFYRVLKNEKKKVTFHNSANIRTEALHTIWLIATFMGTLQF